MKMMRFFLLLSLLPLLLGACGSAATGTPLDSPAPVNTVISSVQATRTNPGPLVSSTPLSSATFVVTTIPTQTLTPIPTASPIPLTVTPVPTYAILRGVVIPEKVSCRYGPGAMYLYLYGMVSGATQDVIGRTDTGKWVLTRSRGDNKACWVKSEFMDIKGDVMSLEMVYPDKFTLIQSNQGYRKPWNVAAVRKGDKVTISWESEALRPGDEESATSVLYVVETWVCQAGQLVFTPLGAYDAQVTVTDEAGCAQASHGRVFFSEKHGYAGPSEIPWPAAP